MVWERLNAGVGFVAWAVGMYVVVEARERRVERKPMTVTVQSDDAPRAYFRFGTTGSNSG